MRIIFFISLVFSIICNTQNNIKIQLKITHDVPPPKNLPSYNVNITNKILTKQLQNKDIIPSGIYDVTISQPGYKTQVIKQQSITTSPFVINAKLVAKERQISFQISTSSYRYGNVSPKNIGIWSQHVLFYSDLIEAHNIIDLKTDTKVKFCDTFQPGKQLYFLIQFRKYKTINITVVIPPGEGPYSLFVRLKPLKQLECTIRKNTQIIDGIAYEYKFTVYGKPLENHHITIENGIGRSYYTIMIDPKTEIFRASIGYLFLEKTIKKFRSGMSIGRPEYLSIPLFIDHCNKFEQAQAISIVEKFLKSLRNRRMLKNCSEQELQKLIDYAHRLKIDLGEKIRNASK